MARKNFSGELIRAPMMNTTKSPSMSAVHRPALTFGMVADPTTRNWPARGWRVGNDDTHEQRGPAVADGAPARRGAAGRRDHDVAAMAGASPRQRPLQAGGSRRRPDPLE